ncbi:hypothetical protein ACJJTC_014915 [Scirpophaga incertulas]
MASKALKAPFIRHVASRGYAHAAPALKNEVRLQTAILPSKTFVAALDNGSPVTRVTVAFKAGCRYEPQTELGVSHVLRSAAGLTTKNASGFIMARKLAQIGASVTSSGDREFVYYTLEATQDNLQPALELLNNLVSNQEFRPWELSDNNPRLQYDIASLSPQVRAVDLLHKAAFRRGLGNSLFISPKRIGKISSESMQHFAATTVTPSRCAIVIVGGSQERAALVANTLQLPTSGDAKEEATKYYGGELRKEMGGDLAHIALAVQGAPAGSPQSFALAVAAKALHAMVQCQSRGGWTFRTRSLSLRRQLANALVRSPQLASTCSCTLWYSGLFGVLLSDLHSRTIANAVLSNAIKSKISMGAAGNLAHVPYVDEL